MPSRFVWTSLPVGARVRVRPRIEDAEDIAGYAPTGTVLQSADDDRGPHIVIRLDSGQTVWAISPGDWEVVGGSS